MWGKTAKMSKSAPGHYHSVGLLDDPAKAHKTIMRAVTDSQQGIERLDSAKAGPVTDIPIGGALSATLRVEPRHNMATLLLDPPPYEN